MTSINPTTNPAVPFDVFALTTFYGKDIDAAIASKKPIAYVMDDSGDVYHVRNTQNGTFIAKADKVPGAKKIEEGFIRNPQMPLIPFKFFLQIVSFFRDVCDEFANDESMLQVYFDKVKKEYFLICPEQTTTKTHITFLHDKELQNNDDMVYVMDIHSHNTMNAFFSGTDDASEQETRLYGVVGRLDLPIPEYKFRISVEGSFVPMTIFDFFERPTVTQSIEGIKSERQAIEADLFFPQVEYPAEWLEVIRKGKTNRSAFSGKGNPRSNGTFGIDFDRETSPKFPMTNYGRSRGGYGGFNPSQHVGPKHSQMAMPFDGEDPFVVGDPSFAGQNFPSNFRVSRQEDEGVSQFGTDLYALEDAQVQRDMLLGVMEELADEERVSILLPMLQNFSIEETEMLIDYLTQEGYFAEVQAALSQSSVQVSSLIEKATEQLDGDAKVDAIAQSLGNLTQFELKRVLTELAENGSDYDMKEVLKSVGKL